MLNFDGIVNRFQKIADQPELYPAIDHIRQGYRRSVYKSRSIYYRINPDDIRHCSYFRTAGHPKSAISVLCPWGYMAAYSGERELISLRITKVVFYPKCSSSVNWLRIFLIDSPFSCRR